VISIVDSGSGQRSVIEGIGKLSTGTKTQIGSFKESVQATTRLPGNRKLAPPGLLENAGLLERLLTRTRGRASCQPPK
jgi:hypothetical protein